MMLLYLDSVYVGGAGGTYIGTRQSPKREEDFRCYADDRMVRKCMDRTDKDKDIPPSRKAAVGSDARGAVPLLAAPVICIMGMHLAAPLLTSRTAMARGTLAAGGW